MLRLKTLPSPQKVPYMSARIFHSQFIYSFSKLSTVLRVILRINCINAPCEKVIPRDAPRANNQCPKRLNLCVVFVVVVVARGVNGINIMSSSSSSGRAAACNASSVGVFCLADDDLFMEAQRLTGRILGTKDIGPGPFLGDHPFCSNTGGPYSTCYGQPKINNKNGRPCNYKNFCQKPNSTHVVET